MLSAQFKSFLKQNWFIVSVLVVASIAALWFALSMAMTVIYFYDPRHMDEPLRPWMTPRYVGMSYDLPRATVLDILGLPKDVEKGVRLHDVSVDLGVSMPELTDRVRDAAAAYRETDK